MEKSWDKVSCKTFHGIDPFIVFPKLLVPEWLATGNFCLDQPTKIYIFPVFRPYSCKQRHRLEAWIHKIKRVVWICSPKPQPCFIVFADWSRIRERSFPFLETTYTVTCSNLSLAVNAIVFSFYNNIVICLSTKHVGALKIGFWREGKTEVREENLLEQGREATTNSTHIWRRCRNSNPGHTGVGQEPPLMHHPCSIFILKVLQTWSQPVLRSFQSIHY